MRLEIRSRLALWYAAVLTVVLASSAAVFYLAYSRSRLARLDEGLVRAEAQLARLMTLELEQGLALADAAHDALEDIDMSGRSLAVLDDGGRLVAGRWEGLPLEGRLAGARAAVTATAATPEGAFRVHRARHVHPGTGYQVAVAESQASVEQELASLRRTLLASTLVVLLLAAGGGWWIAHGALRPVATLAGQAGRITGQRPGERLRAPNPEDELGLLAAAFNDLLARLECALQEQKAFMADASHELRTPVSVARTAIDVTLRRAGRTQEEYRDALRIVAGQMRRLSAVVEDMFTLAHVDAAGLPLERGPFYLDELTADCVKEAAVLAEPKAVALEWRGPSDVEVRGDERRLRQMLMNLLANAVRHTPAGGRVQVELAARPSEVELAVTDGGPGIPEAERERVFRRFVRLDPARSSGDGAGLGLPIARAIAEAHGGTLVLARSDHTGSTFRVQLPLVIVRSSGPG